VQQPVVQAPPPPAPPPAPVVEAPPPPPPAPASIQQPPEAPPAQPEQTPAQPEQPAAQPEQPPAAPQDYRGQIAQAQRLQAARKFKDAAQIYRRLLATRPNAVELHVGLGTCALRTEHFIQATQHFRDALARKPRHAPAILGLADAYRLRGDHAHALEQYRAYLDLPGAPGVKAVQAHIAKLEGKK
jgi:tetratricopeptide (TPR) repeat protein